MEQKRFIPNIPETDKKRVVVVGGGFAGLKLVNNLLGQDFQIILLDKNNFHQFQPLLYQVAIQQARNLADNLTRMNRKKSNSLRNFEYRDKGSMATIGRNLAVAELPFMKFRLINKLFHITLQEFIRFPHAYIFKIGDYFS